MQAVGRLLWHPAQPGRTACVSSITAGAPLGVVPRALGAGPTSAGPPAPTRSAAARAAAPAMRTLPTLPAGGLASLGDLHELRDLRTDVEPDLDDLELRNVNVGAGWPAGCHALPTCG